MAMTSSAASPVCSAITGLTELLAGPEGAVMSAPITLRIAVGTLSLIVIVAASLAVRYRVTYNVWPGQAADARVHWCGRDYENFGGQPLTWGQVSAQTPSP